jgi:hypothetical protein
MRRNVTKIARLSGKVLEFSEHLCQKFHSSNHFSAFSKPYLDLPDDYVWIAKEVPELELDLPLSAIGSGYVE